MKLYDYWRSSASYRVRIALNLKGIDYERVAVDLVAGEQGESAYQAINPASLVPTLELQDGTRIRQSFGIIHWLNAVYPEPALLPADTVAKAEALAAAYDIAMDIHPLNNTRVLARLQEQFGADQQATIVWMIHWMGLGFDALQKVLPANKKFSFADAPGLVDVCLVPQLANARRWDMDLSAFQRLVDIETRCLELPAFVDAAPENQPEASAS